MQKTQDADSLSAIIAEKGIKKENSDAFEEIVRRRER